MARIKDLKNKKFGKLTVLQKQKEDSMGQLFGSVFVNAAIMLKSHQII